MTLYIDPRAGSGDLATLPPLNDPTAKVELSELASGDIMFIGRGPDGDMSIGIELKKMDDFLGSASTGRLQGAGSGQLPRMLDTYDAVWLLWYGIYRPCPKTANLQVRRKNSRGQYVWCNWVQPNNQQPKPWAYVESMVASIELAGAHVKHVISKKEAALWIAAMYMKFQRPWSDHKLFRSFNRATLQAAQSKAKRLRVLRPKLDPRIERCAKVAADLVPSIGFERGVSIAEHFGGSVRVMINAGVDEWKKIDGVGKVIAAAAVDASA